MNQFSSLINNPITSQNLSNSKWTAMQNANTYLPLQASYFNYQNQANNYGMTPFYTNLMYGQPYSSVTPALGNNSLTNARFKDTANFFNDLSVNNNLARSNLANNNITTNVKAPSAEGLQSSLTNSNSSWYDTLQRRKAAELDNKLKQQALDYNNTKMGLGIANSVMGGISSLVGLGTSINSAVQNNKLTKAQINQINQQIAYNKEVAERQREEYARMKKVRGNVQKQTFKTSQTKTSY